MKKPLLSALFTFLVLGFINSSSVAQSQVTPHPDNSPSTDTFHQFGVPKIDTIWTSKDYNRAFKILQKIYETDKYSLPRKNSPYSGDLFEHLISTDNLSIIIDSNVNIADRIAAVEAYSSVPAMLIVFYLEDQQAYERFGLELLEAKWFDCELSIRALSLLDDIKKELGDRINEEQFNTGYTNIQNGLFATLKSILESYTTNKRRYDIETLEHFAPKLANLKKIYSKLSESQIQEIRLMEVEVERVYIENLRNK